MTRINFFFLVSILGLFFQCAKESPSIVAAGESSISGKVLDSQGKPLIGVSITTSDNDASTSTNAQGEYRLKFEITQKTKKTLYFFRYGYMDTALANVEVDFNKELANKNIAMVSSFVTISGKISLGALAKLSKKSENSLGGVGITIPGQNVYTITNSDGSFVLPQVLPSAKVIVAAKSGLGWASYDLKITPGKDVNVNFPLNKAGGSVVGQAVDENNQPIANMPIQSIGGGLLDTTDAQGNFRMENVPSELSFDIWGENSQGKRYGVAGLYLEKESQLTGIDLVGKSSFSYGGFVFRNQSLVVPKDSTILLVADVSMWNPNQSLIDSVVGFEWDINHDGVADTITSGPSWEYQGKADSVAYRVRALSGKVSPEVGMRAPIFKINRVSTSPVIKVGDKISILPRGKANLLGQAISKSGGISLYEWDFNGDGLYDWKRKDIGTVDYRYYLPGVYLAKFRVTAFDGTFSTGEITITVQNGTPEVIPLTIAQPPQILNLVSGASLSHNPVFTWNKSGLGNYTYSLYVGTSSPPDSLVASGITDTTYTVKGLQNNKQYFMQVVAFLNNLEIPSLSYAFKTTNSLPILNPNAYIPVVNSTVSDNDISLSWSASDPDGDTLTYRVLFSFNVEVPSDFENNVVRQSPYIYTNAKQKAQNIPAFPSTETLVPTYWQVVVTDGYGGVATGPVIPFTYDRTLRIPGATVLKGP